MIANTTPTPDCCGCELTILHPSPRFDPVDSQEARWGQPTAVWHCNPETLFDMGWALPRSCPVSIQQPTPRQPGSRIHGEKENRPLLRVPNHHKPDDTESAAPVFLSPYPQQPSVTSKNGAAQGFARRSECSLLHCTFIWVLCIYRCVPASAALPGYHETRVSFSRPAFPFCSLVAGKLGLSLVFTSFLHPPGPTYKPKTEIMAAPSESLWLDVHDTPYSNGSHVAGDVLFLAIICASLATCLAVTWKTRRCLPFSLVLCIAYILEIVAYALRLQSWYIVSYTTNFGLSLIAPVFLTIGYVHTSWVLRRIFDQVKSSG